MIKDLYSHLVYSQIWLHLPMDDGHFGFKKNPKNNIDVQQHPLCIKKCYATFCYIA
jgi:hypothetical protein